MHCESRKNQNCAIGKCRQQVSNWRHHPYRRLVLLLSVLICSFFSLVLVIYLFLLRQLAISVVKSSGSVPTIRTHNPEQKIFTGPEPPSPSPKKGLRVYILFQKWSLLNYPTHNSSFFSLFLLYLFSDFSDMLLL